MKGLPLEALNSAHDSAHLRQADDGEVGRQALLLSQDDATATASQLRCRLLVPLCCVTAEAEAGPRQSAVGRGATSQAVSCASVAQRVSRHAAVNSDVLCTHHGGRELRGECTQSRVCAPPWRFCSPNHTDRAESRTPRRGERLERVT